MDNYIDATLLVSAKFSGRNKFKEGDFMQTDITLFKQYVDRGISFKYMGVGDYTLLFALDVGVDVYDIPLSQFIDRYEQDQVNANNNLLHIGSDEFLVGDDIPYKFDGDKLKSRLMELFDEEESKIIVEKIRCLL